MIDIIGDGVCGIIWDMGTEEISNGVKIFGIDQSLFEAYVALGFIILGLIILLIGARRKSGKILVIGFAVIAAAILSLFVTSTEFRDVLVALASILAVAFAALSLYQTERIRRDTSEKEERDRKGRLVNEITEWALNILKSRFGKSAKELLSITDSSGNTTNKKSSQFIHADIIEVKVAFESLGSQTKYLSKISSIFDKKLNNLIKTTKSDIEAYVGYLDEWQHSLAEDIKKGKNHINISKRASQASTLEDKLFQSAIRLMEKAAEIKTENISPPPQIKI